MIVAKDDRQLGLDLSASMQARDEGIKRVSENGARWIDHALATAESYLRTHEEFITENFRAFWQQQGGEKPHSLNAWGALTMALVKRGKMIESSTRKAQSVDAHARRVGVYRSLLR